MNFDLIINDIKQYMLDNSNISKLIINNHKEKKIKEIKKVEPKKIKKKTK